MNMDQIYRGYSIMPGKNDPGVLIRSLPDRTVVGSAASYYDAQQWIDNQIAQVTPSGRRT
jgi:hypothetical protein